MANLYYGKMKREQGKQSDTSDKWDDMVLHGDNKENREPALAASEVEDKVARYCADALEGPAAVSCEGLLAKEASRDRILSVVDDSQNEHAPAVEDKLDNELCALTEDQLIHIQVEKTDTKGKFQASGKAPSLLKRHASEIIDLKDKANSFLDICQKFPTLAPDRIRRVLHQKKHNPDFEGSSKVRRRRDRVVAMIEQEGYVIHESMLNFLRERFLWNSNKSHTDMGIIQGDAHRVWIRFSRNGETHPDAWYSDPSRPDLSRFAFRIGKSDDAIDESLAFSPVFQGQLRGEFTEEQVQAKMTFIAMKIMNAYNEM